MGIQDVTLALHALFYIASSSSRLLLCSLVLKTQLCRLQVLYLFAYFPIGGWFREKKS